jgi:hypothetical protein
VRHEGACEHGDTALHPRALAAASSRASGTVVQGRRRACMHACQVRAHAPAAAAMGARAVCTCMRARRAHATAVFGPRPLTQQPPGPRRAHRQHCQRTTGVMPRLTLGPPWQRAQQRLDAQLLAAAVSPGCAHVCLAVCATAAAAAARASSDSGARRRSDTRQPGGAASRAGKWCSRCRCRCQHANVAGGCARARRGAARPAPVAHQAAAGGRVHVRVTRACVSAPR